MSFIGQLTYFTIDNSFEVFFDCVMGLSVDLRLLFEFSLKDIDESSMKLANLFERHSTEKAHNNKKGEKWYDYLNRLVYLAYLQKDEAGKFYRISVFGEYIKGTY